jgi:trimeric autotransporter adhesin
MLFTHRTPLSSVAKVGLPGLRALMLVGLLSLLSACGGDSTPSTPTLTAISVGPPTASAAAGLAQSFKATGSYSDGSKQDLSSQVTWSSSNPAVATISTVTASAGLTTLLQPGTTTITATMNGMSGSASLTVTAATLASIDVTPMGMSVASGLTQAFKATGVYSDHSIHDLTADVTWNSSAKSIASISNSAGSNGLARAVGLGSTTISATLGNVSGSTALTVTAATLVSIGVTPANATLAKGLQQSFTATGVYSDGSTHDLTASVAWSSSSPGVGSISDAPGSIGQGTAVSPGSTTITAALESVSGLTSLTVTAASLASITVTPSSPSIAKGLSLQFTATGTYTDHSTQNLTTRVVWSSSDTSLATVSNASGFDGLGNAFSPGTVTVTATLGAVSGSTSLAVTPATLVSIGVTPSNPILAKGTNTSFTATGVYTDNSTENLTSTVAWASSDTTIASISNASGSNGQALAVATGAVTITASLGSVSGNTTLTVTPATLVSIGVTPASPSIALGTTEQFTATGVYTDNSTQNLTTSVAWSSSTTAASISNAAGSNGLASTGSQGPTTITATLGSVFGSTSLTVTPATLVSIGVTPANPSIALGTTQPFTATGVYTDNSTQNLTAQVLWQSSTSAASISNASGSQGVATSAGAGATSISATVGSVSGSTGLSVTPATLVAIQVTPSNPSISNGLTEAFTATGIYTDNSTQNLTTQVTWGSNTPSTATISSASGSQGLATSAGLGTTTITATLGSVSGSTTLTVTAATLVSIQVTPVNPSIANGLTSQFTATGSYTDNSTQNLTTQVTWGSGTASTATISNAGGSQGLATSAGVGSTTITATLGTLSGSTNLTVTAASLVSIAVTPANSSIALGTTEQFTAIGTYTDSSTQDLTTTVTWNSSSTVASVSNAAGSNGLASTAAQGASTITANLGSISGSTGLTVSAATLVSIAVTPANPSIALDTTQQFAATGTYTDNSTQDLTTSATWTSTNPSVASISNASGSNGLATSAATGTTNITAAIGTVISPAITLTVTTPTWTATGSLTTARYVHTATLLPNGTVLVAGGLNNSGLWSAEIYNPATGTWTATGNLTTARYAHTATLQPNGTVLVAGGYNDGAFAVAEIYNPATGTWTATGSLTTARYYHTATLLPNGTVLVAGGISSSGSYLSSAEIYNPATGTWTATGSLTTARFIQTATLLFNGTVLVSGGDNGSSGFLSSAEIYNPATGTWTATGSLTTARAYQTATLLPNGTVLVAGGDNNSSFLSSAEIYNPATGTWTATGSLTTARYLHTATLLPSGTVLVAGGYGVSGFLSSAEIY